MTVARLVQFELGSQLLRQGDEGSSFYVIISGTVRVTRGKRPRTPTRVSKNDAKAVETEAAIGAAIAVAIVSSAIGEPKGGVTGEREEVEEEEEILNASSGRGDHYGQDALLESAPQPATVTATSRVDAMCLERDDFLPLFRGMRRTIVAVASIEPGSAAGVRLAVVRL